MTPKQTEERECKYTSCVDRDLHLDEKDSKFSKLKEQNEELEKESNDGPYKFKPKTKSFLFTRGAINKHLRIIWRGSFLISVLSWLTCFASLFVFLIAAPNNMFLGAILVVSLFLGYFSWVFAERLNNYLEYRRFEAD